MSFKRLDPEDFLVSAESITATAWSTNSPTLTAFYSSSAQAGSTAGQYYLDVYQTASALSNAEVQFAVQYGNLQGSGSLLYNTLVNDKSPSRTVYGQYRTLVYGDENSSFIFGNVTASDFWAVSVERARYKEHLLKGTFNLTLKGTGGYATTVHLTDNSGDVSTDTYLDCGRVYQIVSGSNGEAYTGTGYSTNQGSYGLFLPDIGTILLNPLALSESIAVTPNRASNTDGKNMQTLYDSLNLGASFQLNSEETVTSDFVFVRARNSEFNYTENPSFISGSTGDVVFPIFINSPQTYMTTVGFYNDNNELLAVAKLSRPLVKDFTKESLIRVKLDF